MLQLLSLTRPLIFFSFKAISLPAWILAPSFYETKCFIMGYGSFPSFLSLSFIWLLLLSTEGLFIWRKSSLCKVVGCSSLFLHLLHQRWNSRFAFLLLSRTSTNFIIFGSQDNGKMYSGLDWTKSRNKLAIYLWMWMA